jgi:hypothetical protein
MQALLNVSLDEQVSPAPIQRRYDLVMAAMRRCFHNVVGEIAHVSYAGPDGDTQEACAVLTIEYNASRSVMYDGIHSLARSLGQDCIAIVWPDGSGECIGPRADRWPFDHKFFSKPAIYAALAEAA